MLQFGLDAPFFSFLAASPTPERRVFLGLVVECVLSPHGSCWDLGTADSKTPDCWAVSLKRIPGLGPQCRLSPLKNICAPISRRKRRPLCRSVPSLSPPHCFPLFTSRLPSAHPTAGEPCLPRRGCLPGRHRPPRAWRPRPRRGLLLAPPMSARRLHLTLASAFLRLRLLRRHHRPAWSPPRQNQRPSLHPCLPPLSPQCLRRPPASTASISGSASRAPPTPAHRESSPACV
jgi:hypothetical protein